MTELKVRIVKEEERPISIEESCMLEVNLSDNCYCAGFRKLVHKKLAEIGFVSRVKGPENVDPYYLGTGRFRTEEVRPATPNERKAYHYLKLAEDSNCDECDSACPFYDDCIVYVNFRENCRKLVEGKEFFEE